MCVVLSLPASGMRLSQEPVNGDCEAGGGSLYDGIHQSVFLSAMLPLTTSRDLPLCWEHHSKLLPALDRHEATDVTNWSAQQVAQFVSTLPGCRDLGRYFLEEVSHSLLQCTYIAFYLIKYENKCECLFVLT